MKLTMRLFVLIISMQTVGAMERPFGGLFGTEYNKNSREALEEMPAQYFMPLLQTKITFGNRFWVEAGIEILSDRIKSGLSGRVSFVEMHTALIQAKLPEENLLARTLLARNKLFHEILKKIEIPQPAPIVSTVSNFRAVVVSNDSEWIAASSEGNSRIIIAPLGEKDTLAEGREIDVSTTPLGQLCWHGNNIAIGSCKGVVKVIEDVHEDVRLSTLSVGDALIKTVCFSPDGDVLAVGADNGQVSVYDEESICRYTVMSEAAITALDWNPYNPDEIAFATKSRHTASSHLSPVIQLWNPKNNATRTLAGHTGLIESVRWNPYGTKLISVSANGMVKIWKPAEEKVIPIELPGILFAGCFSPDGTKVAVGSSAGEIHIYTNEGQFISKIVVPDEKSVRSLAWSPDGTKLVAAVMGTPGIYVWDMKQISWGANLDQALLLEALACKKITPDMLMQKPYKQIYDSLPYFIKSEIVPEVALPTDRDKKQPVAERPAIVRILFNKKTVTVASLLVGGLVIWKIAPFIYNWSLKYKGA